MATQKKKIDEPVQVGVKGVPAETLQKLQIIAGLENVANNDVYKQAFETYVKLYEQKNGKIKIKPKGDGLEVI